jgi:hypothetical protein
MRASKTVHKKIALSLALLLSCAPILSMPVKTFASAATNYYVDGTNGSDANNGLTTGAAFKSIQKAANVAGTGDKVEIMAGVYRETVKPNSDGVTFQNFNGDKVTVSGGELVTGWTPTDDAGIYQAPMNWDYQNGYGNIVYYTDAAGNDTSLSQARWPNIPDSLMFEKARYAKFSSTGAISGTISNGGANLQMDNVALAATNPLPNSTTLNAWKDALLVASVANGFVIYTGKVTGSSSTLNFEWPYTTGYLPKSASPGFGLYLTNSYQALLFDVANPITNVPGVQGVAAWYKDVANQQLYVAVPSGADPNTGKIEAKKREFAFDLAGRTGITISGINLRAAGVNFANSSNNMFKGATVEMVDSYNKPFAVDTTLAGFVSGFVLDGDHNTIRDSEVKNMFGFGIVVKGHNNNVINNHIHDFNRYGLYADGINVNGYNHLISHNSIHAGGRAAIGGAFTSSVVAYNDIYDVMKISYDGGIFYVVNSNFGSSEIHHNTVHDSPGDGIYFDNLSFDAVVYNNIIWNVSVGMLINTPNERMILLNNTVYNTTNQSYGNWGDSAADGIGSYGSVLIGNILQNPGFSSQAAGGAYEQHNTLDTKTNLQAMFVDAANKDFALKNPDSQRSIVIPGVTDGFTSTTPVRGAVQPGVSWKSGHDFGNAANINPTYKLNNIPYKQLLKNAGFPTGNLTDWTTTNTPEIVEHNGWDFRASGLIRDGSYGVALNEGDGISQTVTSLKPNTTYNVSVWGKVLGKQVAATTMAAGSDPVTPVNYRSMKGYMIPGTKTSLKFTGVDFGTALYDKVYFGTVAASSTGKIEMYIGDPVNGGTLVATDPLSDDATSGQKGQWHYRNAIALASVSGVKDVYLVFSNTNTTVPLNCYFADFTLFDSTVNPATDYIELGASGLIGGTVTSKITTTTFTKGNTSRPSNFSFTTGPSDTSVTIYAKKAGGGGLTGYVDEFGLSENSTPPPVYQSLNAFEGFENGLDNWAVIPGKGTPTTSTAVKRSGSNSYMVNEDMDAIQQIYNASYNKIVTMWFYDNAAATNMQVAGFVDDNVSVRAIEVNTPTSSTKYAIRLDGTHSATNVTRTTGWHEFKWDYSSGTKVDMYIDGQLVASPTGVTSFKRIILGDQWSGNTNITYFDDISIKDANIKPVVVGTTLTTPQNTVVSGTLSASDANGDPLTYSIVSNGTKGIAVVTNSATGAFTYTPNAGQIGTDTFTFSVNDGVVNSEVATVTVNIADVTSPMTTDDSQSGWHQVAQTIQLTSLDEGRGVAQTFYSLNGSPFVEGNTIQIDQDGVNELRYYSVDEAGNQEAQQSVTISIDKTGPTITSSVSTSVYMTDTIHLDFLITDALNGVTGITMTLDGNPVVESTIFEPFTLSLGKHIVTVTAADNVNNISERQFELNVQMNIDYLDEALQIAKQKGLIKNDGIFNALMSMVNVIQMAPKEKINHALHAFEMLIQAQRGKFIDDATSVKFIEWITVLKI